MKFNEMNKVFDCLYTRPYANDDVTLNDEIDQTVGALSWHMFEDQDKICYNISEKNPPMLKDNVIEYMRQDINRQFAWIREYIICKTLISYRLSNVDLGDEATEYLKAGFDDEEWAKLNDAINHYIWHDYADIIGEEKAIEYFTRINRPEFIFKEEDGE
jgi:hypothetical protein